MTRGVSRTNQNRCEACAEIRPGYDIINCSSHEGGLSRRLCSQCFNREAAAQNGQTGLDNTRLEPVRLLDCQGEAHDFHFVVRFLGDKVAIDACAVRRGRPAGHRFQIIGGLEEDLLALLGRLIDKMRRALSTRHLTRGEYGMQIADHRIVRAGIEWSGAQDGRVPLLVIDGREIEWDEFGRMLMTFEGWQFKLQIADKSEEL